MACWIENVLYVGLSTSSSFLEPRTLFGIFLVSGGLIYYSGISERDVKKLGTCQKGQISSRDQVFSLSLECQKK
jgi:hypothetical protein